MRRHPIHQPNMPDPVLGTVTLAAAFTLHSRPSAIKKIYLDFTGKIFVIVRVTCSVRCSTVEVLGTRSLNLGTNLRAKGP